VERQLAPYAMAKLTSLLGHVHEQCKALKGTRTLHACEKNGRDL